MISKKNDIYCLEDVKRLVDQFYENVKQDDTLAHVFADRMQQPGWSVHLDHMYQFWHQILIGIQTGNANPFDTYAQVFQDKEQIDKWLMLFITNVDNLYKGIIADEAKSRAHLISKKLHKNWAANP